jgi:hypothetical protein
MPTHDDIKEGMKVWLPVAAIVFSVTSFALSFWQTLESAQSRIRPVLVFVWEDTGWYLHNVGSGTALGIVVAQSKDTREWTQPIRVPPVNVGGKIFLHWLGRCNVRALGVIYEDFENRKYTTQTWDDRDRLSLGHSFQWNSSLTIEPWWKLSSPETCDGT